MKKSRRLVKTILQPQIADSSSINAVSFSSACTTKRFPSRCASAIQIVRPLESIAATQPQTPTGFAGVVSDYLQIFHAVPETGGPSDRNCSRASLHSDVVSLYYLQGSPISAPVIRFRHVTKELFSSVTPFFCLANLRAGRDRKTSRRIGFCFARLA